MYFVLHLFVDSVETSFARLRWNVIPHWSWKIFANKWNSSSGLFKEVLPYKICEWVNNSVVLLQIKIRANSVEIHRLIMKKEMSYWSNIGYILTLFNIYEWEVVMNCIGVLQVIYLHCLIFLNKKLWWVVFEGCISACTYSWHFLIFKNIKGNMLRLQCFHCWKIK